MTLSPWRADSGIATLLTNSSFSAKDTEIGHDLVENILREIDQVDLVHRQDHVADAEQACDIGMPARLGENALAGIDQEDGKIGVRGARRHVAGILLMARRVGDDEFAPVGGKKPVGHIDGDALLPLRLQAVYQQSEIDVVARGAELPGILFQRRQSVVEQELGVVEQPPDQGGLAVIHAAAGEKPQ